MLSQDQKIEVQEVVNKSLNEAEHHWKNGGHKIVAMASFKDYLHESFESAEDSRIPGHETVRSDETVIDEFIALVADMRNSSRHLMCAVSEKKSAVSGLKRVYYETSALLPALALGISYEGGNVTEYLGDGVLALFKVNQNNKNKTIYSSYNAAKHCVNDIRLIVNSVLKERYGLEKINIGVGLSISKCLVTLIGLPNDKHPKAFGECVFRATKLSGGVNTVICDNNLRYMWPSKEGGTIKFKNRTLNNVSGCEIFKN